MVDRRMYDRERCTLYCILLLSFLFLSHLLSAERLLQNLGDTPTECVPFVTAFRRLSLEEKLPFRFAWTLSYDGPPVLWFSESSTTPMWAKRFFGGDGKKLQTYNTLYGSHHYLLRLVNSFSHRLVVDVGANMGQEAILFSKLGHRVFTFEPLKRQYDNLVFNLQVNCIQHLVSAVNSGTGSQVGSFCLQKKEIEAMDRKSAKVRVKLDQEHQLQHARCPAANKLEVTTLDISVLPKLEGETPLLLKLDCEGCELDTLRGASLLLSKYPPEVIIQEYRMVHPRKFETALEIIALLEQHQYTVFALGPADYPVSSTYPIDFWLSGWQSRRMSSDAPKEDIAKVLNDICQDPCMAVELLALHPSHGL
mmetsp:Transcript_15141/g.36656  ORF Transcript_15141/g.36656 Transcript_15141/m.36656 type:complete len:365 (-) Transcript_15141:734-1828(-)